MAASLAQVDASAKEAAAVLAAGYGDPSTREVAISYHEMGEIVISDDVAEDIAISGFAAREAATEAAEVAAEVAAAAAADRLRVEAGRRGEEVTRLEAEMGKVRQQARPWC